jgi:hypothetical protein
MRIVGTTEAANLLGICTQRLRQLLAEGRVEGAKKVGRFWQIPLFNEMPKIIPGKRGPQGRWKKRLQQVPTYIHINQLNKRQNENQGLQKPVIVIQRGKHTQYCHELEIPGPCKIVYSPHNPKPCGAKIWIEVAPSVVLKPLVFTEFAAQAS